MDYRTIKIGKTSSTLVRLDWMGIAPPDQLTFYPYQKDELRGDLTWQGAGYMGCNMTWDILSTHWLSTLIRALFDSETQVTNEVYVTIPRRSGWFPNDEAAVKTYRAEVHRPLLTSQNGQPVTRSPSAYSSVTLEFILKEAI